MYATITSLHDAVGCVVHMHSRCLHTQLSLFLPSPSTCRFTLKCGTQQDWSGTAAPVLLTFGAQLQLWWSTTLPVRTHTHTHARTHAYKHIYAHKHKCTHSAHLHIAKWTCTLCTCSCLVELCTSCYVQSLTVGTATHNNHKLGF